MKNRRFRSFINSFLITAFLPAVKERLQDWLKELVKYELRKAPPKLDTVVKGSVVPELGEDYTLLENNEPHYWWLFFDFSNARGGDIFEISIFSKIDSWQPFEHFEIAGFQTEPILGIGERFLPAIRVEIKQAAGVGRKRISYSFLGLSPTVNRTNRE